MARTNIFLTASTRTNPPIKGKFFLRSQHASESWFPRSLGFEVVFPTRVAKLCWIFFARDGDQRGLSRFEALRRQRRSSSRCSWFTQSLPVRGAAESRHLLLQRAHFSLELDQPLFPFPEKTLHRGEPHEPSPSRIAFKIEHLVPIQPLQIVVDEVGVASKSLHTIEVPRNEVKRQSAHVRLMLRICVADLLPHAEDWPHIRFVLLQLGQRSRSRGKVFLCRFFLLRPICARKRISFFFLSVFFSFFCEKSRFRLKPSNDGKKYCMYLFYKKTR